MQALRRFLTEKRQQDPQLANHLTILELPNLLAWLEWLKLHKSQDEVLLEATQVEQLLSALGHPRALAHVERICYEADQALKVWGKLRFRSETASVLRLLQNGELQNALKVAESLLQMSLQSGENAYSGASYDIAQAYWLLGRVLQRIGSSEATLSCLDESLRRFEVVAKADNDAARMVSLAISERGDCLVNLGRLEEAETAYRMAMRLDEDSDRQRDIAVTKDQIGVVYMLQKRYDEALALHNEARQTFESIGEPNSVANSWHQIGIVHRQAGEAFQAEAAYRQALAISVQQHELLGEAKTLHELGNLYDSMGRMEEAASFSKQAADVHVKLQNLMGEGRSRANLALTLIKLRRYDDVRRELQRAILCMEPYGHSAQPWILWNSLYELERKAGTPQTVTDARQQAIQCYMAYRREGGENQTESAQFYTFVAKAVQQGNMTTVARTLALLGEGEEVPSWAKVVFPKFQAILNGSRDLALASDPALDFRNAAELQLLLEQLGGSSAVR